MRCSSATPPTAAGRGWSGEHAAGIDAPFSADAARYVRNLAAKENRHVDPRQAVQDLLADWAAGEVTSRRDRNLALCLATQRAQVADQADTPGADQDRDTASTPGVVDLLARRQSRQPELRDDLDDVFARYYATHPHGDGLEVFDE